MLRRGHMRIIVGITLCLSPLVWMALGAVVLGLREMDVLNTQDLWPLSGDKTGTVVEYLFNFECLLMVHGFLVLSTPLCILVGCFLLWTARRTAVPPENSCTRESTRESGHLTKTVRDWQPRRRPADGEFAGPHVIEAHEGRARREG